MLKAIREAWKRDADLERLKLARTRFLNKQAGYPYLCILVKTKDQTLDRVAERLQDEIVAELGGYYLANMFVRRCTKLLDSVHYGSEEESEVMHNFRLNLLDTLIARRTTGGNHV